MEIAVKEKEVILKEMEARNRTLKNPKNDLN